ncbi:hypothetical protein MRX96_010096 [Rhipicephalus microplus]
MAATVIPEMEYCFQESQEHRCMCTPLPPPHSTCQAHSHEESNGQWLPCDPIYYSRDCQHQVEMLPFETIAAQQAPFPGFFVVEALTPAEDDMGVTHQPSITLSFDDKNDQIGSWTNRERKGKAVTTIHFSESGSSSSQSVAAKARGRCVVRRLDSTGAQHQQPGSELDARGTQALLSQIQPQGPQPAPFTCQTREVVSEPQAQESHVARAPTLERRDSPRVSWLSWSSR